VDTTAPSQTWRSWLAANGRRFLLFARDQTRCEADAHDVLQDALVETWRRQETGTIPPDPLVFATIRRRAIDLGRRTDRRNEREHQAHWFDAASDEPALDAELERAVKALAPMYREVVVLKVWSGLTFQQVADALGVPLNTAASRYRYALEHLRSALKEVAR
jgi:RNA polymerase sigma-70 factor, ECF subfamily